MARPKETITLKWSMDEGAWKHWAPAEAIPISVQLAAKQDIARLETRNPTEPSRFRLEGLWVLLLAWSAL